LPPVATKLTQSPWFLHCGNLRQPLTLAARANRHWNDAGCARVTLHECRHTFAALMVSAMSAAGKFNAKVLQTLMGHSSITRTTTTAS
jgi:integrase